MLWFSLIAVAVVLVDQLSKIWVAAASGVAGTLTDGGKHICWIIKNFLEISYYENRDGMMGIFAFLRGSNVIFIVATFLVLAGIIAYMIISKNKSKWLNVSLMLVIGGAVGNLIDRIVTVYVRDFIHVIIKIGGKEVFPFIFNVADMALVVGAIMLIIYILFLGKDAVFPIKKKTEKTENVSEMTEDITTITENTENDGKQ